MTLNAYNKANSKYYNWNNAKKKYKTTQIILIHSRKIGIIEIKIVEKAKNSVILTK